MFSTSTTPKFIQWYRQSAFRSTDQLPQCLQGYPPIIWTGMYFTDAIICSQQFLRSYLYLIFSYLPNFYTLVLNMTALQAQPRHGSFKNTHFSNISHTQMFFNSPNQSVRTPLTRYVFRFLYAHIQSRNCFKPLWTIRFRYNHCASTWGLVL